MDKRLARGRNTRQSLVDVATGLFAEHGYEAVSIEMVRVASGISRGALFHHFATKEALFAAVLEHAEARVAIHMQTAAARCASDPRQVIRAGCTAWLELAAHDPAMRQIILIDAPSVVGWRAWREIDARHGLGLLKRALSAAGVPQNRIEIFAQSLLAVLVEVALLVAAAPDDTQVLQASQEFVELVLSRLTDVEVKANLPKLDVGQTKSDMSR